MNDVMQTEKWQNYIYTTSQMDLRGIIGFYEQK